MNFWRIIAWMVLIFLVGTAFYLFPAETISLDSPLTRGWLDLDTDTVYGHMLLAGLGAVSIVSLVVSVYYTSMRHFMHSSDSGNLLIIFLLLLFSNPSAIFFSPVCLSAICLIWAQEVLLAQKKFLGSMLISLSSLFYAPLVWLIPLSFLFLIFVSTDFLKNLIIVLSGLILPLLYIGVFRFLLFDDATYYIEDFYNIATNISLSLRTVEFPQLFEIICFVIIALVTVSYLLKVLNRLKISLRDAIKSRILFLLALSAIFFLFSSATSQPLVVLIAAPLAFLYSYRFANLENTGRKSRYIEVVLILSALVITRLSYFV